MQIRQVTILCPAVWLCLPAPVHAEAPQRHAIIIGINDYADPAIPDLRFAESDAKAIYQTLVDPAIGRFNKDHVTLMLGKDATPSAIKAALYKLRGVGKDDLVVIFYSGHGAKEGDEAFWVTQAAERKALPATALRNKDIREFLAKIPAQRLVILLDCCYAASTIKKTLDDPASLFGAFAGKGRVTIAGAAENQEALEYEDKKAGVFTYFLVSGLRGQADGNTDGVVTFEELWTYLGDNVRKASVKQGGLHEPKIITEAGLTPQFLLTFNPAVRAENEQAVAALRKLFDERKITGAQYDEGYKALSEPAIGAESVARRKVFADLAGGRLAPEYLKDVLDRQVKVARVAELPPTPSGKPTLAVVPFDTLGEIKAKDAGKILAEHLLPHFAGNYTLIDQTQLKHFVEQDDLTLAGLAELAKRPRTKALSKAVKLRAVRYLIVGTISGLPDGSLSVTARMSDWQTGRIEGGRIGQIAASGWPDLLARMGHLAGKLGGSPGHVEVVPAKPPGPPKELTLDLGGGVAMDLILIPAGEFMMGSHQSPSEVVSRYGGKEEYYQDEHPQHRVRIDTPFYLGKTEVTVGQFRRFVEATAYKTDAEKGGQDFQDGKKGGYTWTTKWEWVEGATWRRPGFEQTDDHPVVLVSWNDAKAFCDWLARKAGRAIRLPTEAEWEYACRGGTRTAFWWGDQMDDTGKVANVGDKKNWNFKEPYKGMPMDDGFKYTGPVGHYRANGFGLYDMIGNVWEWCDDWYDKYPGSTATSESFGQKCRVLRGGSWDLAAVLCRCANRDRYRPANRLTYLGFRLASGT